MTQTVESVESLIQKRQQDKKKRRNQKLWRIALALVVHLAIGGFIYLYSQSKLHTLKEVEVRGQTLLSAQEVVETLNPQSFGWFNFMPIQGVDLESNPLIKNLHINHYSMNRWLVTIEEHRALAQTSDAQFLLETGQMVTRNQVASDLPLIENFTLEDYASLSEALRALAPSTLTMMSKLVKTPVSYDDRYVHLYMQDGIQVFSGLKGLIVLDNYSQIKSVLNPEHRCIAIDETKSVPYSFPCAQVAQ